MRERILFFVIIVFISSCIKRIDGPIDVPSYNYPKIEIPLLEDYSQKVYYNIAAQKIVKTSKSYDWEIAFSNNPTGSLEKVIMNYALGKSCNGFTLQDTNYSAIYGESEFFSRSLLYANYYDSFASLFSNNFQGSINNRYVYYLHFGGDIYKKLQIIDYTNSMVRFRYSNLNGTNENLVNLPLNPNQNYSYYSLQTNVVKDIEPINKDSWDLEFTHYTTFIYDFNSPQMYSVTGVLTNPVRDIQTAILLNKNMEDITINSLSSAVFTSSKKAIGYEWKKWSSPGQQGFYTIDPRSYAVRISGKYYSMQFVEFSKAVNGVLTKGYPTFLQNSL
jgi:hypothetical protein